MPLSDYTIEELSPRKLTKDEIANPQQVIYDFFSYAHLPQIRDHLWEYLKVTVTGSYCKSMTPREKTDFFSFYEKLEKVIEAVHLLHARNTSNPNAF